MNTWIRVPSHQYGDHAIPILRKYPAPAIMKMEIWSAETYACVYVKYQYRAIDVGKFSETIDHWWELVAMLECRHKSVLCVWGWMRLDTCNQNIIQFRRGDEWRNLMNEEAWLTRFKREFMNFTIFDRITFNPGSCRWTRHMHCFLSKKGALHVYFSQQNTLSVRISFATSR